MMLALVLLSGSVGCGTDSDNFKVACDSGSATVSSFTFNSCTKGTKKPGSP